jgi:predicted metal-dependent enzyme (double-stranded beta helix superfamily)
MALTLDEFTARCRAELEADDGPGGREKVCALVREALLDPAFVAATIPEGTPERQVLFEDPSLGFTVLAHAYTGAKTSGPHDHGPSWAIYGQAAGETVMTDFECLSRPDVDRPGEARRLRDYVLKPGDAYLYEPGDVHAPRREGPTRLLRIEGVNMDRVKRLPYREVASASG